jgi:hypothetical protein
MPSGRGVWEKLRQMVPAVLFAVSSLVATGACRSDNGGKASSPAADGHQAPARAVSAGAEAPRKVPPELRPLPTRVPDARRIVAIGDLHGDLDATRRVLRLARAIDEHDRWIGGSLVVVQTGDQLDRGDDERAILDLLERLSAEANQAGGAVHVLNGNHEIMNAAGDLRYVTPGGFAEFVGIEGLDLSDARLTQVPEPARARAAAFMPGAPYAAVLAERNVVMMVGDTVFVHGGVLPEHVSWCGGRDVACLERLNEDVRRWLIGTHDDPQAVLARIMAPDSLVWTRAYSDDPTPRDCQMLEETLALLSAKRMVVGHTVQREGVTSGCEDKVWRVDVGLAKHYGGTIQALEIEGDTLRILREE